MVPKAFPHRERQPRQVNVFSECQRRKAVIVVAKVGNASRVVDDDGMLAAVSHADGEGSISSDPSVGLITWTLGGPLTHAQKEGIWLVDVGSSTCKKRLKGAPSSWVGRSCHH